jgi:hypothetical protein
MKMARLRANQIETMTIAIIILIPTMENGYGFD